MNQQIDEGRQLTDSAREKLERLSWQPTDGGPKRKRRFIPQLTWKETVSIQIWCCFPQKSTAVSKTKTHNCWQQFLLPLNILQWIFFPNCTGVHSWCDRHVEGEVGEGVCRGEEWGWGSVGGGQEEPLPRPHPFPQVRNPVLSSCCSNTAEPRCLWGNLSTLYKISTKITSHLVMGFYLLGSNCSRLNALSHFASEVPLIFPFLPSICSVPRIPPAQASLLEDLWIGRTPWLDLSGFALCEGEEQGF